MTDPATIIARANAGRRGSTVVQKSHKLDAQAAIAALNDAGLMIVPVEPTEAMIDAGSQVISGPSARTTETCVRRVYKAMIGAAK